MLKDHLAVAELLKNLIKGNTDHISRVTYRPEKTAAGGRLRAQEAAVAARPRKRDRTRPGRGRVKRE